ncbi:hypothetical protein LWI29_010911 [Acer saccharum]|uniref:Uncharacterized protein n=1 Tax=Acer saccharum TaxID=4024 RepID=A0AA39VFU1_ACESA|nr:hypothetical protein LWI29_010911 [Acer saccharum]
MKNLVFLTVHSINSYLKNKERGRTRKSSAGRGELKNGAGLDNYFDLSTEDLGVLVEWLWSWSFTNKESNAFLGGRHGKLVTVEVNSQLLEVPIGVLPSFINESDKEEMYRLHMEDQEFYTPEKLAKVYNTAAERQWLKFWH